MKKSKFLLVIAVIFVAIFVITLCVSCGDDKDKEEGTFTLVIAGEKTTEYVLELSIIKDNGVTDALDYLKEKEGVIVEYTTSVYGAFFNQVGELKSSDADRKYVAFYTNVENDFDVSEYATTYEYKDIILRNSGVGASSMTVKDKAIILITLATY